MKKTIKKTSSKEDTCIRDDKNGVVCHYIRLLPSKKISYVYREIKTNWGVIHLLNYISRKCMTAHIVFGDILKINFGENLLDKNLICKELRKNLMGKILIKNEKN